MVYFAIVHISLNIISYKNDQSVSYLQKGPGASQLLFQQFSVDIRLVLKCFKELKL